MKIVRKKWVPINFPEVKDMYIVSDYGDIYSLKTEKFLKPIKKHNGYYRVNLQLKDGGEREYSIHRIVAIHFIPLPDGYTSYDELQVNHNDGDKSNNAVSNLEWATGSENIKHAISTGLLEIGYGENSSNHKYDEALVRSICDALEKGYRGLKLIQYLNLDKSYLNLVRRIRERRHWTTVSKDYNF